MILQVSTPIDRQDNRLTMLK
ncbi:hypothetical protein SPV1_04198 [Mariprofundus ferrooxydans PV-1]|uniref:Uncharacterized protein n=1 Tax=Mariprofundus ferrooxydans PV-1 TaxID=314345 RepID=Q0F3F1_9PROT|nr:hypothetical protein SPV1_04198 [Mariprofundus ferrooxydans PV-1]